jgi:hypothetical protein
MSDEFVIFPIGGFLPRAVFWFLVGTVFLAIDCDWFLHRQGVPVTTWMPWTIGLVMVATGPYFLCCRSLRRWNHYFWLRQKFNYGRDW